MSDTAAMNTIEAGKTKELKGVHGWLLFRVILYLVGPIWLLKDFSYIGLALTGVLFAAGIYLLRGNKIGVKLAKIGEGLTIALGIFLLLLAMFLGLNGESPNQFIQMGIKTLTSGVVWYAYFVCSVRVKNTYFGDK